MNFFRRLRYLFRRRFTEAEMAEEMRYHLEQRAAGFATDGLSKPEAQLAAQRKFGNLTSIQEQLRETHGWLWLDMGGQRATLKRAGRQRAHLGLPNMMSVTDRLRGWSEVNSL